MNKAAKSGLIYSQPTTCLHCHLVVELFHEHHTDPARGAWKCPNCGHEYPFAHWKIKRQVHHKPCVAASA